VDGNGVDVVEPGLTLVVNGALLPSSRFVDRPELHGRERIDGAPVDRERVPARRRRDKRRVTERPTQFRYFGCMVLRGV
jgi:hypothetical protein